MIIATKYKDLSDFRLHHAKADIASNKQKGPARRHRAGLNAQEIFSGCLVGTFACCPEAGASDKVMSEAAAETIVHVQCQTVHVL